MRKARSFTVAHSPWAIMWLNNGAIAVCADQPTIHIHTPGSPAITTIVLPVINVCELAWHENTMSVFVSSRDGRISVYDRNMTHIRTMVVGYKGQGGIAVTDSYIFVTSSAENLVYRLNTSDGSNKIVFAHSSAGLMKPNFICANGSHVAVSCSFIVSVVVFDTHGKRLFAYGGQGCGPGQLNEPRGVAFAPNGQILISDSGNHRVSIVSPHGCHIQDIRLNQHGLGNPWGLAVTKSGQLAVGCCNPNTVIVYDIV